MKYLFITLFFSAFVACKNTENTTPKKKVPMNVSGVQVKPLDIKEYLEFNGVTRYQKKENIRAHVTGYISWMPFKIGDPIKQGQTFSSVRTKEQNALQEAVAIDSSLGKYLDPIRIPSNATGVITQLNITTNDYVAEGDVLAAVVQPKSLVVEVNVPYEYEDYITMGTPCEILLQNGESIHSKITGVLPTINPMAQSQVYLIALPNGDLPENLNVQVKTVFKEAKQAVCIPKSALQTNELITDFWVMKVLHDSLAVKQTVTPMLQSDSLVQVKPEELKPGDVIIAKGAYQMQDSTLVSIH
ncbi:efflux RND transporter periplasmic adaptor subunit [Gaetbulibacter aestuarii]|uniref:HlyD family efflux transporter periplasmic adaptor subunit n=1 Tax=Gaetbulibacter aestuarii TaxID=1502358 RepID=A0ABW7N1D6_9FLAO